MVFFLLRNTAMRNKSGVSTREVELLPSFAATGTLVKYF
jgi:hypothetical protein